MPIFRRARANVIHRDQATHDTSIAFGMSYRKPGAWPSRGSVGDRCDKAMCESFFADVSNACSTTPVQDREGAALGSSTFLEGRYNAHPRPAAPSYLSLNAFEQLMIPAVDVNPKPLHEGGQLL